MGQNPYAVNFIALPENPHLEEQLAWIEERRPPFAVIAAGEPSYAARLQEHGIQTIYVASSAGLIRIALEAGVRFVVLEGNEAGGHVGEHSTLTLAQIALELKRKEPELFRDRHVVLAGGIYQSGDRLQGDHAGRRRHADGYGTTWPPGKSSPPVH